ncbi:MAG: GNAT family N-acetyltransferase [Saprospiraceae bacterium]|nr:GNAT family N-acetyltransferase [Saprospiraceae bacterium]
MSSTTILENVIDERADMVQLTHETLDRILAEGWRLLGKRFVRHNFSTWRMQLCRTIPLRIRLTDFELSKSQRKILRQNEDLLVISAAAKFDSDRERLFDMHRHRFHEKQSTTLASFIHPEYPHLMPTEGRELAVHLDGRLIACSFFHLGEKAVSGTYCVFNPDYERRSLGTLTMLLEILMAKEMGLEYYYHGYTHDIPSQFDYKLSFSGLESMNWETGKWSPRERLPVREWKALLKST